MWSRRGVKSVCTFLECCNWDMTKPQLTGWMLGDTGRNSFHCISQEWREKPMTTTIRGARPPRVYWLPSREWDHSEPAIAGLGGDGGEDHWDLAPSWGVTEPVFMLSRFNAIVCLGTVACLWRHRLRALALASMRHSHLMAADLTGPRTGPGESRTPSLLLLLFLLPHTQAAATAHRHPASEGVAFSRDVGRTPPSPGWRWSLRWIPAFLPPRVETQSSTALPLFPPPTHPPRLCLWPALPWCHCYSHTRSFFPQLVASVIGRGGSWEAWIPLRKSGRGRSVCTMQASTSVVGPSLMNTGSCQPPTALAGEWAVLDTIPMEV